MDVYGLIGAPVDHSLSPVMFEAAFRAREVDATYVPFRVEASGRQAAIKGANALGIAGLNVTIPHKESVLEWAEATDVAQTIGAANVLDFDHDPPLADNTDVLAMARVIDNQQQSPTDALILGAGGAARAYVHALTEAGWTVTIANRTERRAQSLAEAYAEASTIAFDEASATAPNVQMIVNATPVGLEDDVSPIDARALKSDHLVVDAVYRPERTRLLTDAEAAGADTVGGDTLLLEQAVATYERWRPEDPPKRAMAVALEDALRGGAEGP